MKAHEHRAKAEAILDQRFIFPEEEQAYIGCMLAALSHAVLALVTAHEDRGYLSVRRWRDADDDAWLASDE